MSRPTSDSVAVSLDASSVILSTLSNAAKLTPVPFLQNAADVALNIIQMVQDVKSNKDAFRQLADDACALVYIVLCSNDRARDDRAAVTPAYLQHTRELAE
ncbi:hypothetical protein DXG01_008189 [Tephrocybe rancida]|nr:hypothetical protein DXG01_008189 [Tephrocybe rancida]